MTVNSFINYFYFIHTCSFTLIYSLLFFSAYMFFTFLYSFLLFYSHVFFYLDLFIASFFCIHVFYIPLFISSILCMCSSCFIFYSQKLNIKGTGKVMCIQCGKDLSDRRDTVNKHYFHAHGADVKSDPVKKEICIRVKTAREKYVCPFCYVKKYTYSNHHKDISVCGFRGQ